MDFPTKISFSGEDDRNCLLFDAGLHTLHLRKGKNEGDQEFVTRFLIQYLKGCESRDPDAKGFFICLQEGEKHIFVGKICSEETVREAKRIALKDEIEEIVSDILERKFGNDGDSND